MRVCVCTIVHHPEDARILHRQIRALLDAGHEVTYIAPFRACNVTPWREVSPVDVPRAGHGGRRPAGLRALRAAHRALAEHAAYADVVLLHDPELVLFGLPRAVRRRTVVWDVHEDTGLTGPLGFLKSHAERRHRLLLADEGLRRRFPGGHPVVPDTAYVSDTPPAEPGDSRVVYVGRLSVANGALDMIELAGLLHPAGIAVELIGPADPAVRPALRDAQRTGVLRWYGFVPNDRALRIAEGALAGLVLAHDDPRQRHAPSTKAVEYMAHGVPVLSTPLPATAELVRSAGAGLIVPFRDPAAAAEAVHELHNDAALRTEFGKRGYTTARARFHWPDDADRFVAQLETWAGSPRLQPEAV